MRSKTGVREEVNREIRLQEEIGRYVRSKTGVSEDVNREIR